MLRHFPIALHLRIFGAAGIGYVVGGFGRVPTNMELAVAAAACAASIAGWLMMRPVMRAAQGEIALAHQVEPRASEEKNDAAH